MQLKMLQFRTCFDLLLEKILSRSKQNDNFLDYWKVSLNGNAASQSHEKQYYF